MNLSELTEFVSGDKFTIYLTPEAKTSWEDLEETHQTTQAKSALINLGTKMQKYAQTGVLHSPKELNDEKDGFYAFKNEFGFRAYWWYGSIRKSIVVSHFILKKKQGLKKADKKRMVANKDLHDS